MLSEVDKRELRQIINQNKHEIFILSLEEMDHVVLAGIRSQNTKEQWRKLKKKAEITANYYAAGADAYLLSKLVADLGYAGTQVYVKQYGGKAHIILKGHPGLRNILNATKYGIKNAKVVKMGLGKYGAINAAKTGGVITIVLLSAYRVIDYFMTDSATLTQLIGVLAVDVVKVGITTGASILAGTVAAATFSLAIGPLLAVIVVGVGVSIALTYIDEKYGITDRVIAGLDELSEGIQAVVQQKKQALIKKGHDVASDISESVIDYAVERAQQVLVDIMRHLYGKLTVPKL